MVMIDALAWIHLHEGRLLCVRSQDKDAFYIPGGKRESGESDWQALQREVWEELQVHLIQDSLQFFGVFKAPAHSYPMGTQVKLTCYRAQYIGAIRPAAEIAEMAWFDWSQRTLCAPASQMVLDQLHQQGEVIEGSHSP